MNVAAAISAACRQLGKPFPAEAVQALEANWYSTAAELAALSDETARSLGVPLRLKSAVVEMLASDGNVDDCGRCDVPTLVAQQPATGAAAGQQHVHAATSSSSSVSAGQWMGALVQGEAVSPADLPAGGALNNQQQLAPPHSKSSSAGGADLLAAALDPDSTPGSDTLVQVDWARLPIEERRTPKLARFQNPRSSLPKLSKRTRPERYALLESEMSPAVKDEFAAFRRFCTVRFFGAQAEPISEVTAAKYEDHMRGMLGYMHRERDVPLDALSFSQLLPSSGRDGVAVVFDYILWLHMERNISVRTEGLVVRSAAAAAKFLYHHESKVHPGRGETPYSDLGVIKELRAMSNNAKKQGKVAPRVSDEEKKWLDWPDYLRVCSELRLECAALDDRGRRREPSAVAYSLQRYLIFSILSCVPDRQRTLRELEVGRTLLQDREGRWIIRHGPQDYKTGRAYGERPPLTIAPHIYPELEAFMSKWRAFLKPQHNFLFSQRNGEPLTDKSLYKIFWTTAYRLTGKRTNPHLVRDSIVTYLRGGGATERELEALALYMGHSIEMQRSTYDRRTKEQKVEPAVELLAELNRRAMLSASSGSESEQ